MASLGGVFDAGNAPGLDDYSPLPAGDYLAMMVDSCWKENKKRNGQFLECKIEILDESAKGRVLFARLNLSNPNPKAVEIANRELASIAKAVDVPFVTDSSELHRKPFIVRLSVKPGEGQYGPSNEIKNYLPASGAAPAAPAQAAVGQTGGFQASAPAAPAGAAAPAGFQAGASGAAPWKRQ